MTNYYEGEEDLCRQIDELDPFAAPPELVDTKKTVDEKVADYLTDVRIDAANIRRDVEKQKIGWGNLSDEQIRAWHEDEAFTEYELGKLSLRWHS